MFVLKPYFVLFFFIDSNEKKDRSEIRISNHSFFCLNYIHLSGYNLHKSSLTTSSVNTYKHVFMPPEASILTKDGELYTNYLSAFSSDIAEQKRIENANTFLETLKKVIQNPNITISFEDPVFDIIIQITSNNIKKGSIKTRSGGERYKKNAIQKMLTGDTQLEKGIATSMSAYLIMMTALQCKTLTSARIIGWVLIPFNSCHEELRAIQDQKTTIDNYINNLPMNTSIEKKKKDGVRKSNEYIAFKKIVDGNPESPLTKTPEKKKDKAGKSSTVGQTNDDNDTTTLEVLTNNSNFYQTYLKAFAKNITEKKRIINANTFLQNLERKNKMKNYEIDVNDVVFSILMAAHTANAREQISGHREGQDYKITQLQTLFNNTLRDDTDRVMSAYLIMMAALKREDLSSAKVRGWILFPFNVGQDKLTDIKNHGEQVKTYIDNWLNRHTETNKAVLQGYDEFKLFQKLLSTESPDLFTPSDIPNPGAPSKSPGGFNKENMKKMKAFFTALDNATDDDLILDKCTLRDDENPIKLTWDNLLTFSNRVAHYDDSLLNGLDRTGLDTIKPKTYRGELWKGMLKGIGSYHTIELTKKPTGDDRDILSYLNFIAFGYTLEGETASEKPNGLDEKVITDNQQRLVLKTVGQQQVIILEAPADGDVIGFQCLASQQDQWTDFWDKQSLSPFVRAIIDSLRECHSIKSSSKQDVLKQTDIDAPLSSRSKGQPHRSRYNQLLDEFHHPSRRGRSTTQGRHRRRRRQDLSQRSLFQTQTPGKKTTAMPLTFRTRRRL